MTKIGIIGDCHLGASLKAGSKDPVTGIHSRLMDYYTTLIYAIDNIAKECKVLFFTGDIFEHRYPHMIQQQMFSQALRYAIDAGIEAIHIVIGNHDQQRTSSTTTLAYLAELRLDNIIVHSEPDTINIGNHSVHVYPYRDRRYLGSATYAEAISVADKQIRALRLSGGTGSNIMIGHMAIEGTFFPEEEAELYTDNELMLSKSSFELFDLSVMGHVHTPGQVSASPPIYYIGSLEKRGAFEGHDKQYAIINLDDRSMEYRRLPCRNFYEFSFDLSDKLYGVDLMHEIERLVDEAIAGSDYAGSIIKCDVSIQMDDLCHLDIERVSKFFSSVEPSYVFPPVPMLKSTRVPKTELQESASETETWAAYVKSVVQDAEFCEQLIQAGSTIIAEEEV